MKPAGAVDMEANRPAFEAIAQQLSDYAPSDVYNCDETGLYLKVVSNPKYRLLDLDLTVESKLEVSYHGTGYMTSDIFLAWLLAFDQSMEGRKVALLMDNAPGHGKEDLLDRKPRNIPLDAVIIMSFKVKYGRLIIPVISYFRHQQEDAAKVRIPKGHLWACWPEAWDKGTTSAIRNCFARVPVLPDAMREALKNAAAAANDAPDIELAQLRAELVQLYLDVTPWS
ncbi:hypothetical protein BGZ95_009072 [Linnemannia exigua]|uniref:DDE-1 domain-containing protein n=1 Tax=Linnemannia exigua TaxID=604196 RepID=A0AAD4DDS7_9FUNG|nr:hypothetical protein BGZ95_009072 [Linnemannia exigua]